MKSLDELQAIRVRMKARLRNRVVAGKNKQTADKAVAGEQIERSHILVCGGTGCTSSKSGQIFTEIQKHLKDAGIEKEVKVIMTGCFGLCAKGPVVVIYPEGSFYEHVKPEDAAEIVSEHIVKGNEVTRLLAGAEDGAKIAKAFAETDFYRSQQRVALEKCGLVDPENVDEYLGYDGYCAYEKVVKTMTPMEVCNYIEESGLRGRGGAGFPTGKKWKATLDAKGDKKYIICNADEGDPGAFMDRSILEGDPHCVLEAMMIAGYAVGADQGYIYVRAEYPIAVKRLEVAIKQAREYGILGKNAMGLGHSFDIDLRLGAGAFVCGEGTALIQSIEGRRGEPKQKPPHTSDCGLFSMPTVLNNVETFANICPIILKGKDWFRSIGSDKNSGTKVFALGGKITNTGLVEVPMGMPMRNIIEEIGGGVPGGHKFKAAQTGGPSGGCIPASLIDTPVDFDNLAAVGSMMGSGGLIVMDDTTCMVDIAKFFLEFTVHESCGKCTPCRIGNKMLYEMLDKITAGKATMEDLDKMEELCAYIKNSSLCALGQTAPNPVVSTLKHFRDEYIAHVRDKKCPAGVCKDLLSYFVIPEKCIGCQLCKKACPVGAISGELKAVHVIDQEKCIKCGACMTACRKAAIIKK